MNTRWIQNGVTVAGGNGRGSGLQHLNAPIGMYLDDNLTIYVADYNNNRIMKWKIGAMAGKIVVGRNGPGNQSNQLNGAADVVVDKQDNSLIICDSDNRRIVRWSRQNGTDGQTIISDIDCGRLIIDYNGCLYVSNRKKNEVRRWKMNDIYGTLVVGGNGQGNALNQLDQPTFVFVDEEHSVYVSDWNNHRVMKWMEGATEGTVVAGGNGQGNRLTQLSYPQGVFVDQMHTTYVVDCLNHRIVRWLKGATQGTIVVGGNEKGDQACQLSAPVDLSFDQQGNLYVVDNGNHRIQRFNISHQ